MKEGQPVENPSSNADEKLIRIKYIFASGMLGMLSGGISYGISSLLTDSEHAIKWGLGVGGGLTTVGLGSMWSSLSMDNAEDYLEQGKKGRAHLEVARAILEGALGTGSAGAIPGIESGDLTAAATWGIGGLAFGALSSFLIYRDRIKPFPELVTPSGIQRGLRFPDRNEGKKLPPVYRASTLQDLIEFREVNKKRIIKWAGEIPSKSTDPHSTLAQRLVTSVFIVPNLQHFPAFDPEGNQDMKLVEKGNNIVVHPDKHSFLVWPYQTRFDLKFGASTFFQEDVWQEWRDRSWRHKVVLLVQYQTKKSFSPNHLLPEEVSDNYWLLDIISNDTRQGKRVVRLVPRGKPSLTFNPTQI